MVGRFLHVINRAVQLNGIWMYLVLRQTLFGAI